METQPTPMTHLPILQIRTLNSNLDVHCAQERNGLNADPTLIWIPWATGMGWNYFTYLQTGKEGFKVMLT